MPRWGNYTCWFSGSGLKKKTPEHWLRSMTNGYKNVTPYELSEGQIKAWKDSHKVIVNALKSLPAAYERLYIVFEYVMPDNMPGTRKAEREIGIRADAIVVGKNIATALEFKQKNDFFIGNFNQAVKYKTRLEKYHIESRNMTIKAVLVETKAKATFENRKEGYVCSPDKLADVLKEIYGKSPYPQNNMQKWLNSEFKAAD